MDDVIGFTTYPHHETKKKRWGCRGTGPSYSAFYDWFNSLDPALIDIQTDDWPWHYFGFKDPELDQYIYDNYPDDIIYEEEMPETEDTIEVTNTPEADNAPEQTETVIEVANDNEAPEPMTIIDPEKMAIQGMGVFHTLQVGQNPMTGEIEMGIVQLPLPLDMIRAFQEQMGEEMAKENMKFVIYKGRIYLAPIRTSTLLGFD